MTMTRALLAAGLLVGLSLATVPAAAVGVAGGPGPIAPRNIPRLANGAPPAATLDLVEGTIAAIDTDKRTLSIAGSTLAWQPSKLRVFSANGLPAGEGDLHAGARVRFALDPAASALRTVVLIYLQATP